MASIGSDDGASARNPWAVARPSVDGLRMPLAGIAFAIGIGAYFSLPVEPSQGALAAVLAASVGAAALWWRTRWFAFAVTAVILAGLVVAQARTNAVAAPVLGFRYYGPVEGRVVAVDRSSSERVRITLDRVRLERVAPDRTPARVRVSLHWDAPVFEPRPGDRVMTTAHLTPPPGPVEPGAFDFQRHAWFLRIGATGYTRLPLLRAAEATEGRSLDRARHAIADRLRDRMPGTAGAVAAALAVGDRSALGEDVTDTLRDANLAHLLAISGLHMGLAVGFVFWVARAVLAAVPGLALRHPIRSWAAVVALPAAMAYLALSGAGVATQRSFVMAVVALGAVIAGRRALSLRSLALAGAIVLILRPETLVGPGFQMSFAATGALIATFDALRRRGAVWRGWRGALAALVVSSLVAGLATAPFAAAHFGRVPHYGLVANLLSVPVMGTVVMPSLVTALLLWPIGLEGLPLWIAGQGIEWILAVAETVAGWRGSVTALPAASPVVVPMIAAAMAVAVCLRGWGRLFALPLIAGAALHWAIAERPAVLVSGRGALVGVDGPEGRWLSHERGEGFAAENWLAHDGDAATQAEAANRTRPSTPPIEIQAVRGERATARAVETCAPSEWIVTDRTWDGPIPDGCNLWDAGRLRRTGAVAVHGDGRIVTASDMQCRRPWTGHGAWRDQ